MPAAVHIALSRAAHGTVLCIDQNDDKDFTISRDHVDTPLLRMHSCNCPHGPMLLPCCQVYVCAAHPADADTFATVCSSGKVRLFSAARRDVLLSACVGYPLSGVAFSQEAYAAEVVPGWAPEQVGLHFQIM